MMAGTWGGVGGLRRPARLLAAGVAAALGLIAAWLAPELIGFIPWWLRRYPIEWFAAVLFAVHFLARTLRDARCRDHSWVVRSNRTFDRAEAVARKLLNGWFVAGVLGLAAAWLLLWIPHYLYWPWCRDTDSYALMAQEWDSGVLPYRHIRSFNFPGHIYLHWVLGKLFGWGRTGVFNALDAGSLLLLGGAVFAWSRRRLGLVLPGAIGYLGFLAYYLDVNFENVGERDWHAPLCMIIGLLALDAWPGRASRWLSAVLAAAAFTIRPNVILFFPASLLAVMIGAGGLGVDRELTDEGRPPTRRSLASILEWLGVLVVFVGIGFAPLVSSGLLGDFARGLAMLQPGGSHNDSSLDRSARILLEQLRRPDVFALTVGLVLLSFRSSDRALKETARVWLAALAAALLYRPIHPLDHAYLKTPLALVAALAWAVPIAWLVRTAGAERRVRLSAVTVVLGVCMIMYESIPFRTPGNCSLRVSADSIRAAATGGWPSTPPGAWLWFESYRSPYRWDPYCELLQYLRETTTAETIVANVLKRHPYPAANGVVGRRSPFRVESGVPWTVMVAEDLDEEFAGDVERLGCDSVVILSPAETDPEYRFGFPKLTRAVQDRYVPEARFGMFEVWRRRCNSAESSAAVVDDGRAGARALARRP